VSESRGGEWAGRFLVRLARAGFCLSLCAELVVVMFFEMIFYSINCEGAMASQHSSAWRREV
jgi:hypothetical protein